ncbi:jhamt [Trichonephila clavata]|uniref:Jhamt n=1 Tax=Trichonephila clavata TaxID=2740835 RepID=A0A8X6LNF4_TRICU|nr:jhamt [Trichonephila clavata]
MAQSSLSSETSEQCDDTIQFVKRFADEFQWQDLSEDVVMDIGCGDKLNCCIALLSQFPNVRAIIAVDKESTVFQMAQVRHRRIQYCVGDILERDSLKSYEGKMNKVISTNTFHHIMDKEMAFRNVYRLLKPGGEAGFFFCVNSYLHTFLTDLSEIPKYGAILKDTYATTLYPSQQGEQYYKELLEKIGFKNVRVFEEERRRSYPSDKCFKVFFLEDLKINLKLSPEAAETFMAEVLELYEKKFGRKEGKLGHVCVQLNLWGVKPMEI